MQKKRDVDMKRSKEKDRKKRDIDMRRNKED